MMSRATAPHPELLRRVQGRTNKRAFTLLEVVLALAIMSVLAVSLFSSLHVAFKSRDTAEASLAPVREIEAVMEIIRGELESALPPRGTFAGAFVGTDYKVGGGREDDDVIFYSGQPGAVGLARMGDIKQVQLRLMLDESSGTRVLVRRVTETGKLLSPNPVVVPDDEILCRGVASFDIIYYDGFEWWSSWDSAIESDSLPVAVQVTLELEPFGKSAIGPRISRIMQIPCTGEPDESDQDLSAGAGDGTEGAEGSEGTPPQGGGT